jgi:hypothetical protein
MKNCKMITVIPGYEFHQCDLSNVDKKKTSRVKPGIAKPYKANRK